MTETQLHFGSPSLVEEGWWDARALLGPTRGHGIFYDVAPVIVDEEEREVFYGAYLNPTDHRFLRVVVFAQDSREPRLLINRSQAFYFQAGIQSLLFEIMAHLSEVAEELGLEPQLLRLGNNSHGVDEEGKMVVGLAREPSVPHWHVLFRQAPGTNLCGVPLLGECPVGTAFQAQTHSEKALYDSAMRTAAVQLLRKRMDRVAGRQTFVMVRHGMTEANKLGILQGAHPTLASAVLTSESRDQAREVGHRLRERWENATDVCIVSSDLSRARETAQLIQEAWPEGSRPQHVLTPDIRERGLGSVEGMAMPASDIGKARAIYEERMREGGFPADWKPLETFDAMRQRCAHFLAEYVEDGPDAWLPRSGFEKDRRSTAGRVLICVSHGFCLQVLLALMTGEKEKPASQRLHNLQHTRLVRTITGSSPVDGSTSSWRCLEHRVPSVW